MTTDELRERAAWPAIDTERGVVTKVSERSVEWESDGSGSMGTGLSEQAEIIPKVGDRIVIYGSFGSEVRGMDVNGQPSWFRTAAQVRDDRAAMLNRMTHEREETFARDRDKLDAQYAALPENFRRRIDRFRAAKPGWRAEYETYEMTSCMDAVRIAAWLTEQPGDTRGAYDRFRALDWKEQKALIPDLFDGHSGNSFGFAMRLGYWHATQPEMVVKEHGALVPLVGCEDYGCQHSVAVAVP